MSAINVTQVQVLDNPQFFGNPLQFEIQYECLQNLENDLEWKLTYVGSAESDKHDQVLDTVLVGPVGVGSYKFVFQADPPDVSKIPSSDILGVTVLLLTCSYNDTEFIRVGYYVNNEYADEELRENPPEAVKMDRVVRNILAEKPRVTRFPCEFDTPTIPTAASMEEDDENREPAAGVGAGGFGGGGGMAPGFTDGGNGGMMASKMGGGEYGQQQQQQGQQQG
eukprot:CAMPEP_0197581662 /NCGR_PEP_ID=MMETSP1326-20131121/5107_1 /TAXON_ID=1155430 /ORGANISM="Genus nov. species nov., Strain RCC2288" /LENGTH=222 /DNA_ID=CAMNT_0043145605 /DNA_START=289 /DNA_END=953 /DNA_ORIENTATION=-